MSSVLPAIAKGLSEEDQAKLIQYAETLRIVTKKKGKDRWPRSTYSEKNSFQMLPYIKAIAARRRDIEINIFPGANLQTMYLKWMGALQWYIESTGVDTDLKITAALIRATTKAKKDTERGVLLIRFVVDDPNLHFNNPSSVSTPFVPVEPDEIRDAPASTSEEAMHEVDAGLRNSKVDTAAVDLLERSRALQGVEWKESLIEWCQSGDASTPFVLQGLVLTNDDVQFVRSLAENSGLMCEVNHSTIRLVKI